MRLLIITQKVDKKDPILGFFHTWIEKLSKNFDSLVVICLEKGESDMPHNVKVLSLGKEAGINRLKYLLNFYRYILKYRKEYDAVFVHMNQEYVLLGGLLWKIFGKKIFLWRNHPKGNLLTYLAVLLSEKVFCTSPFSFTARFKKSKIMPVGIDVDKFRDSRLETRVANSILFLGRMAPIKKPHLLIEALELLKEEGVEFSADFYGDPLPKDSKYYEGLKKRVSNSNLSNQVFFHGAVPNDKTPELYSSHEVFVNLTPTGSMDKTIFEAGACGCIPIVANLSLKEDFGESLIVQEVTPENVAAKIKFWLSVSESEVKSTKEKLRKYIFKKHGIDALIDKLVTHIKT